MGLKAGILRLMGTKTKPEKKSKEPNGIVEIKDTLAHIYKLQKEMAINVEDLQCVLDERHTGHMELVNTLISVIDYIDDFYSYTSVDKASPLFKQAEMMLNGAIKKASAIGLARIHDENTDFDSTLNTIETSEKDSSLPNGHISKIFKSGYSYNGKIIRKSKVVVIKN